MTVRFSELQHREVVNVCDGCRVGFVCDLELDCTGGNVCALIVPGRMKFFGLFGRDDDFVIPWNCIRRIGNDIILVEVDLKVCRKPCRRKGFF